MSYAKTVLVAASPEAAEPIFRALSVEYDVIVAHSLADAVSRLNRPLDAVVGTVFFDHGAVYELFREVKRHAPTSTLPCFCVKAGFTGLSPSVHDSISLICAGLGVFGLSDFSEWERQYGEAHADRMLRQLIEKELRHTAK